MVLKVSPSFPRSRACGTRFLRRSRTALTVALWLVTLAFAASVTGCSSTSASGAFSSPQTGAHVTVSISPTNSTLSVGQQVQFSAAVTGTSNMQVSWSVGGVAGGNATLGTISAAGLYTAPAAPPPGGAVTVMAASAEDSTATASATITVMGTMTIAPLTVSLPLNGTQQFTATENGAANPSVQWEVNGITGGNAQVGTISASGLYQAPATLPASSIQVTAVDAAQAIATQNGSAQVPASATAAVTVFDPAVAQAHNDWLTGLQQAAASYGCTNIAVLQQPEQSVNDAIAVFSQTAGEGSCLALQPISTDPTVFRYSFAWGGVAGGKNILYLSDVGELRIWNGAEIDPDAVSTNAQASAGGIQ